MTHRFIHTASQTLLAALLLHSICSAQSGAPMITESTALAPQETAQDPAIVRSRLVEIDVPRLRTWVSDAAQGDALDLQLFPDVQLAVAHQRTDTTRADGLIWHGEVVGKPDSSVMIAIHKDALAATLRFDDRLYSISATAGGLHRVARVDAAAMPGCGTTAAHALQNDITLPFPQSTSVAPRAGSPDIELMVVYTTAAMTANGGTSGIRALIDLAVAETNTAYQNSGVNQRVVLVHTEEMVGYVENGDMNTMLGDLQADGDGNMDEVHPLRAQYRADLVAMICQNGQYCGLGYLMTNVGNAFRNNAFSVTKASCATGNYTFAHELGHNMGCAHDPGNASIAAYPYSYGYRTPNQQYRTVMAYAPGARIPYFSNLTATYSGMALGTPLQDNARSLNDTAATVAGWGEPPVANPQLPQPYLHEGFQTGLSCFDCTPGGMVHFAYSARGGGPAPSRYGVIALSRPIYLAVSVAANATGYAYSPIFTPSGTAGVTLWVQALDESSGTLSNGVSTIIQ